MLVCVLCVRVCVRVCVCVCVYRVAARCGCAVPMFSFVPSSSPPFLPPLLPSSSSFPPSPALPLPFCLPLPLRNPNAAQPAGSFSLLAFPPLSPVLASLPSASSNHDASCEMAKPTAAPDEHAATQTVTPVAVTGGASSDRTTTGGARRESSRVIDPICG